MKEIPCKWGQRWGLTLAQNAQFRDELFVSFSLNRLNDVNWKAGNLKGLRQFVCYNLKHRLLWVENMNMKSVFWKTNFHCMRISLCALFGTATCQPSALLWCTFCNTFDSKNTDVSNSTYCFLRVDMGIQFYARCDSYLSCAAHLAGRVASQCWADSKGVQKQSICKDLITEKHVKMSVKGSCVGHDFA